MWPYVRNEIRYLSMNEREFVRIFLRTIVLTVLIVNRLFDVLASSHN